MLSFEDSFEIGPAKTHAHFGYIDVGLMSDLVLLLLVIWRYEVGDMHEDCSALRRFAAVGDQMLIGPTSCDPVGLTMHPNFRDCSSARWSAQPATCAAARDA